MRLLAKGLNIVLNVVVFSLLVFTIMLIILWCLVVIYWPAENLQKEIYTPVNLAKNSGTFQLKAPVIVLTNPNTITLEAIYYPPAVPVESSLIVTMSVSPQSGLLFSTAAMSNTNQVVLYFHGNDLIQRQFIAVINGGKFSKVNVGTEINFQTQQIPPAGTDFPHSTPVPLEIEGTLRSTLRQMDVKQVNQQSPMLLLTIAILSALNWAWREFIRHNEKREEEGRNEAAQMLQDYRQMLQEKNITRASSALKRLQQLTAYLSAEELNDARYLLQVAEGQATDHLSTLRNVAAHWPEEAASALIYAAEHSYEGAQLTRIKTALRTFPAYQLSLEKMTEWQSALQSLGAAEALVTRDWPLRPSSPNKPAQIFPAERAELEIEWLYGSDKGLFWTEHTLYKQLCQPTAVSGMHIVEGLPGSGRSAFALALGRYLHSADSLAVCLAGRPSITDIQAAFARTLLHFVTRNPLYLVSSGPEEKTLLARCLINGSSLPLVQAELQHYSNPEKWGWFKKSEGGEGQRRYGIARL